MSTTDRIKREYAPTQAGVEAMKRHTALVGAAQEAIALLEGSFGPDDHVPGVIEDAIGVLRSALTASVREGAER